jgi:hypothetical protein
MAYRGAPPSTARALRLTMITERVHHGVLHGAWWPRGRDLATELPALIAGLDAWLNTTAPGEHVSRILMRLSSWDAVPARVHIAGRRVRMAWSSAVDAHGIGITSSAGNQFDLLVIPPTAPARQAGIAAGQAINPTNALNPTAILAHTVPAVLDHAGSGHPWPTPGDDPPPAPPAVLRLLDDGDPDEAELPGATQACQVVPSEPRGGDAASTA